jgi:hypothetical protein
MGSLRSGSQELGAAGKNSACASVPAPGVDQEFDNAKTRLGNNVCSKKIVGEEHSLMSRPKTGRLANAWANEQRPRKINQREQTSGAIRTAGQQCAHGQKFKMRKIKPEWSTMREGKSLITKGQNLPQI